MAKRVLASARWCPLRAAAWAGTMRCTVASPMFPAGTVQAMGPNLLRAEHVQQQCAEHVSATLHSSAALLLAVTAA